MAGKLQVAASLPQGDMTVIAGQAWPVKVHGQRDQRITRVAHAKTFRSLIQIARMLNAQLSALAERLQLALLNGDLYVKAAAQDL